MLRPIDCLRSIAVLACSTVIVVALSRVGRVAAEELETSSVPASAGRAGVLVMRNGKVVEGKILKSGDDYSVQSPSGGIMFVPGSLVSMHCQSLRDAYKKLRDHAAKNDSPHSRCALARWCITNQMMNEARSELTAALDLEPDHDDARTMLVRLNELLDPDRPATTNKAEQKSASNARPPRPDPDEVESLGRLSREQAHHFTRRIQPILVNNCAVAGCHGSDSDTGFSLQRVVRGGDTSRIASERNLAEVIEQIDVKSPRNSPLLTVPTETHGRRGRSPFAGPRGAEQLGEMRKWVYRVAKSERARERDDISEARGEGIEQVSATVEHSRSGNSPRSRRKGGGNDSSRGKETRFYHDPFQVGRESQARSAEHVTDPFDPSQFNQTAAQKSPRR